MSSLPSLVRRDRYAALERCTYLNQASLGLIPESTIDAMEGFLRQTAQVGNLYLSDHQVGVPPNRPAKGGGPSWGSGGSSGTSPSATTRRPRSWPASVRSAPTCSGPR